MDTGRSNAGSRDLPIFIGLDSKKCMICRKWQTEDYFTLSGRELVCNKCDYVAKLRRKIREEEAVRN